MKRIQYACLNQTIHFRAKDEVPQEVARREIQAEYTAYKQLLDQKRILYKIVEERVEPDGSIIIRIKKKYNGYDVGDYLD